MASVNNIKVTVGLEATAGTPVARAYRLPVTGLPGLDVQVTKEKDPALSGNLMPTGYFATKLTAGGDVPLSFRPSPGCILAAYSAMGGTSPVSAGVQIGGCLRLRYTGSEASAKISSSASGDTLTGEIGDYGSEAGPEGFGDYGDIDLTDPSVDTLAELVAVIDAYADWDCEKVFGADSVDTSDIISITSEQGKDRWVYVFFTSTTSGAYLYTLQPHLGTTERPTLSMQVDGRPSNEAYAGAVVNQLSIEAALQSFVSATASLQAFKEYANQTQSGTTVSSDATVTGIDTRNLIVGMTVTGSGIQSATTISSITTIAEEGELELSKTATASATVTLTFAVPDTAATLEDVDPMVFWKGSTSLAAAEYPFVSNISLQFGNNGREETFGQGSISRQYNQKGDFDVTGTIQIPLDSTSYAHRAAVVAGTQFGLSFYFYGKAISGLVKEMMIVNLPYCEFSQTPERPENGGIIDIKFPFGAIAPKGGYYGSPVTVYFICGTNMT